MATSELNFRFSFRTLFIGLGIGIAMASFPSISKRVYLLLKGKKPKRASVEEASQDPVIQKLDAEFRLPTSKLKEIIKHFIQELEKGLAAPNCTIKALPSYVTKTPSGQETGRYLALDLGGTNLRVCEILLEGHGKHRIRQKKFKVSDEVKVSSAKMLFGFIAECILEFLDENKIDCGREGQEELVLGFTFSYPIDQTSINSGTLIHWNKGFEIEGVVGKDVVRLLESALRRKKLNIKVVAVVNDTVGTLIAHAYEDPQTAVGVILGTGTNAAYIENMSNIPKMKDYEQSEALNADEMIVNIEWGAFDNERKILPITKYDAQLDRETENPGKQIFEKMISGLYLGEIARLTVVALIEEGELFQELPDFTAAGDLLVPYKFETAYMSRIERDHSHDLDDIKALLEDIFNIRSSTLRDRQILKRISELIGIRSARLSVAAIAGVLTKNKKLSGCTIAIDGSVFEHYPHFKSRMYDALTELYGIQGENIRLSLARDGSGVGAALTAAIMEQN